MFIFTVYRIETCKTSIVADRIKWADSNICFSWAWAAEPKWRTASDLSKLIEKLTVYTPSSKNRDSWVWKFKSTNHYSSNSLANLLFELDTVNAPALEPTVLNTMNPQKIGIYMWRVKKYKVSVRSELDACGIDIHSTRCPVCNEDIETLQHILLTCTTAKDIWSRICKWWNLDVLNISNLTYLAKPHHPWFTTASRSSLWQAIVWASSYFI
ncbi:uncharacterized protein [Rutidosis leptorrhynchoides]|uniref:uncharacterized protein n=1 Tax=Rutidosis leptorrhynchoides TaxID=125765 RepID=UPI003A99E735